MKFTDGYWKIREGMLPQFAVHAYDIEASDDALTVYAPARQIITRGDVLNVGLLTVRLSAPMPDVLRVRITHFAGERPAGPDFSIPDRPGARPLIEVAEERASIASGGLTARVSRSDRWLLEYLGGSTRLTSSAFRSIAAVDAAGGEHYMHEELTLSVGELVYGLGERFTPFVKNGQVVDIWNEDGGTSSEQAYKNIPFYLTNRGYGVLVDHPGRVSFEVASEKVSRVQFSAAGQSLEYLLIYGPTPKEVVEKLTALTGRPALPPAWSFGLWLSTSFTTSYDEETVSGFISGMEERRIPLRVFHFDCFWMREFNWCDLCWDPRTFPDPRGLLERLRSRGLKISVWINPYIAQRSPLFAEGAQAGYLIRKPNGDVWQTDLWQAGMGIVDFTNPEACDWFAGKLRALVEMGVDTFKTDFGERIPTEVAYHDGSDPERMHNYFTYLYNRTVFGVLEEEFGPGGAVVFARSATTGSQSFPVHWGGDCESTFESMAESLRGGLSLGLCGFGFWSHDIGGFEGKPDAAVYKRWIAFGLLSSHSRLHGSSSYRVPWLFDEEAVEVLREFTRLKHRLMPYLYAVALEARGRGLPAMRAMLLEFPDDPTCAYLDRQYMLGSSLLVAPVLSASGEVEYYLPAGRWTHLLSGETRQGPGWFKEVYDFHSLPLFVRPDGAIALGSEETRPDYDYREDVTVEVYLSATPAAEGSAPGRRSGLGSGPGPGSPPGPGDPISAIVPSPDGEETVRVTIDRAEGSLVVRREGRLVRWRVLLAGVDEIRSSDGCTAEASERGTILLPEGDVDRFTVTLA